MALRNLNRWFASYLGLLVLSCLAAQDLFVLPAARVQHIANSPTTYGLSADLGIGDSLKGYWFCARGWSTSGAANYALSGFDLTDKLHAVGVGPCLEKKLSRSWSLQFGGYVDYWWGSRVIAGDPLYWVGSYKGKGLQYCFVIRTCHRLGKGVHLSFGGEASYRQVHSVDQEGYRIPEREFGDGFFGAITVGLWLPFRIKSAGDWSY